MLRLALALLLFASPALAADTWPMGRFGGAPTIASGCGSGSSVTGFDSGGIVTLGSGAIVACVLNFSTTYSPALRCLVSTPGIAIALNLGISTTQLTTTAVLTGGTSMIYFCFTP
jgi:hypothetical protein